MAALFPNSRVVEVVLLVEKPHLYVHKLVAAGYYEGSEDTLAQLQEIVRDVDISEASSSFIDGAAAAAVGGTVMERIRQIEAVNREFAPEQPDPVCLLGVVAQISIWKDFPVARGPAAVDAFRLLRPYRVLTHSMYSAPAPSSVLDRFVALQFMAELRNRV